MGPAGAGRGCQVHRASGPKGPRAWVQATPIPRRGGGLGWGRPAGGPRREAGRTRAHGGNQRCCFIYITRATSCLMRYRTLDSGEVGWSRPSEEDTVVGENPPTQNKMRMRKPLTESPTPLGKRKNRWKVQTIRENGLHYRRNRRPPPCGPPAERAQAPQGTRRRDASVRSSWVNRVSPLIYYIYVS